MCTYFHNFGFFSRMTNFCANRVTLLAEDCRLKGEFPGLLETKRNVCWNLISAESGSARPHVNVAGSISSTVTQLDKIRSLSLATSVYLYFYTCLSVRMYVCMTIYTSVNPSVYLYVKYIHLYLCLFICLSVVIPIPTSVYPSVYLYLCLPTHTSV
jgi:hypothetical protein